MKGTMIIFVLLVLGGRCFERPLMGSPDWDGELVNGVGYIL